MVLNLSSKQQTLAMIAARASTPPERFQAGCVLNDNSENYIVATRKNRLYQLLGIKDDAALTRLFASSLPDLGFILETASSSQLGEGPLQMRWIETLDHIIATSSPSDSQGTHPLTSDRCLLSSSPIPFEELLLPFVHYARDQLQTRAAQSYTCLSEQAHSHLERWLLQSLSRLAGQAFQREFSIFRMEHSPFSRHFYGDTEHRDLYEHFIKGYGGEKILSLFEEYSMLARLLVVQVGHWIDACQEFLLRLARDYEAIAEVFFEGREPGPVVDIEAGCSDPHSHGRTVFLLTFDSGDSLVYKPRNMSVDHAFSELVAWVNTCGISPPLKEFGVLSCANYGWMEYIPWMPCESEQEVEHYYQRIGMLLCLLYLLGGMDMHHENLIACGDMPVLIDLETVIYPGSPRYELLDSPPPHTIDATQRTAIHSGLLPSKFVVVGGKGCH